MRSITVEVGGLKRFVKAFADMHDLWIPANYLNINKQ
jgi:hypothetical protein